jgi:tetraacyldisaccharide 4'-kinase
MPSPQFNILRIFLWPFALLYGIVVGVRNFLFDFHILKSTEFKIPVISVGNISVGGTGKTPHVEYLVSLLKEDYLPAILSRGYKRTSVGFKMATMQSTVFDIGDEPRQIKQKFPDMPVAVDSNRVNGINKLLEVEKNIDVVLLDDAYQHRWVKPGLSILLVDYNRMITYDWLLPYGRLRESARQLRRAHIILITKCPDKLKPIERRIAIKDLAALSTQKIFFTSFIYGNLTPVFPDFGEELTAQDLKKNDPTILLVTGIASPRMLKRYLRGITTQIKELKYPDHYSFSKDDIQHIINVFTWMEGSNKIIVTTEKDAMRLQFFPDIEEEFKTKLFYIPVNVIFLDDEEKKFDKQILAYVGNNKTNRSLVKGGNWN